MNEEAKKCVKIGFSVMPLGSISLKPDGSKNVSYPVEGWKKYQTEFANELEIDSWNYPNLGIVTGELSGIVVLDVDSYKAGYNNELFKNLKIPPTPVQKTGRGGYQYFFKRPKDLTIRNTVSIGGNESCIDIRADGGMVIAPPSKTSFGEYEWVLDPFENELAELPESLLNIIKNHHSQQKKSRPLSELIGVTEGSRNMSMASVIGKMCHLVKPENWDKEIPIMVKQINSTYKPPLDAQELNQIYASITSLEAKRRLNETNIVVPNKNAPKALQPVTEVAISNGAMSFKELMSTEFPEARFILEPFFEANTVNMLSAPPNTWKSWLLFYFAESIAKGEIVFERFATEESNILIVNEEDTARAVQDRFRLLNITNKDLPIYFHIMKGFKIDTGFTEVMIKECKEKNIKVLFLDSLRALHNANENDSTEMQTVLDHLKTITREGITVVFTHHHKKAGIGLQNEAEMSRGTTAINAAISGHLSLEEKKGDNGQLRIIVKHLKSKASEKLEPFEIKIVKEDGLIKFLYDGEYKGTAHYTIEAKKSILRILTNEKYQTVKQFVGLRVSTTEVIREALKELEAEKLITSITRRDAMASKLTVGSIGKSQIEKIYYLISTVVVDDDDDIKNYMKGIPN